MKDVTAQVTFEHSGTWYAPGDVFSVDDEVAQRLFEHGYISYSTSGVVQDSDVNAGTETFSGDGVATAFTIPHGLTATPSARVVWAESVDAAGDRYVTADATNLTVTFIAAPASGTNNVVLGFDVRA